ncbi:MAG TPA: lipid A deacylase LpxR family protein [Steroidobacteraceae bacterium]
MGSSTRHRWLALAAALAMAAPAASGAEPEPALSGVRLQIDNDLFAGGGGRDRDYTGGLAFSFSGTDARDRYLSLDPALAAIDRLTSPVEAAGTYHSKQIGLMAFTPRDVTSAEPVYDDRPYASLLFTTNQRVRVAHDGRTAWTSALTIGVLGLSLTESLHSAVHDLVGSARPRGYAHQISAGGEPTARYSLARHFLLVAHPTARLDVKATVQGSVGYLTETSGALTVRYGKFATPWWSYAPELTDYIAAPMPVDARRTQPELYLFAGVRLKARAYNAFLQGQFRESEVRYSFDEIRPLVAEAWIGFVTQVLENTQVSYTLNYQTAELRNGQADRDAFWGAVQVSHNF